VPVQVIIGGGPPVPPEADHIAFEEAVYEAFIPKSGSTMLSVKAKAYDENGKAVPAAMTYSLAAPVPGISINSATGVITITDQAAEGVYTIEAEHGVFTDTAELTLSAVSASELDPFSGTTTVEAASGNVYSIGLFARFMSRYNGSEITLAYTASVFSVASINANSGVTITQNTPGLIKFIPEVEVSDGTVEILTLQATRSDSGDISMSYGI